MSAPRFPASLGSLPSAERFHRNWNAADLPLANDLLPHVALETAADHRPETELQLLGRNDEPISGYHRAAKTDVVHAAKANHFDVHQIVPLNMVAAQLGRGLAHNYARHERHTGHMAADP